jgi:hypothetical protein
VLIEKPPMLRRTSAGTMPVSEQPFAARRDRAGMAAHFQNVIYL